MDVMRTAIAGKDDEQFLGEQDDSPMLQAVASPGKSTAINPGTTNQTKPAKPVWLPQPVQDRALPIAKPVATSAPKPVPRPG